MSLEVTGKAGPDIQTRVVDPGWLIEEEVLRVPSGGAAVVAVPRIHHAQRERAERPRALHGLHCLHLACRLTPPYPPPFRPVQVSFSAAPTWCSAVPGARCDPRMLACPSSQPR